MTADVSQLRVLEPHPGILAFYDGRVPGHRFAEENNWVDDGALSLGIASYAVINGDHALVYDTHVSVSHGRFIRRYLEGRGANHFTVVLSHWHLDHVAGTEAFSDCQIIANAKTAAHLKSYKTMIEAGQKEGPPAISPLVLPNRVFNEDMPLKIGSLTLRLIEANIHSDDATVLWIPSLGILFAGDTLEDTITYVGEPENFSTHLKDLDRLWELDATWILPNHGDPKVIADGGYGTGLIRATQQYVRILMRCVKEPALREQPLEKLIAGPLQIGWIKMFPPYEEVHRHNLKMVLKKCSNG